MLYVFEMANNHQGSVEHGKKIIREFANLAKKNKIVAAIKFQFRQLDTFIHKDFQKSDLKYVKRFNSTRLSKAQFADLISFAKTNGLKTMATPFDNESLMWLKDLDIDIVKIASCSVDDWPLLNAVAKINRRIIISTAGADFDTTDRVYELFKKNSRDISFMHCVGDYPTPLEYSNLDRIKEMMERYEDIPIGISTHESPLQKSIVPYAVAIGCKIIEKHVGVETDIISLNAYSCKSIDMQKVIDEVKFVSIVMAGKSEKQKASLRNLKRGIYLKQDLKEDHRITEADLYYAMPLQEGQASVAEIDQVIGKRISCNMQKDDKIMLSDCFTHEQLKIMKNIRRNATNALLEAGIPIEDGTKFEISAHYGLENFDKTGCVIINKINRAYCKKILLMKPQQSHPTHHHIKKEETFELLSGDCVLVLNSKAVKMKPGKPILIPQGVDHSFSTKNGCIIEEISTTHYVGDSVYQDPNIFKLKTSERKFYI